MVGALAGREHRNRGRSRSTTWAVLDVDARNGGETALARLLDQNGPLPSTKTARTGGGGAHYLLVLPEGVRLRGKLAPGLDLLGRGSYFLVAPSLHPCGAAYEWTSPADAPIAFAPTWLVDLARAPAHAPAKVVPVNAATHERARRYLAKCDPAISGSGGHTKTFLAAQKLVRGFELDEATAFELMYAEYNSRCQPPWSARELRHKVRQAAQCGQMTLGALLKRRLA